MEVGQRALRGFAFLEGKRLLEETRLEADLIFTVLEEYS